ncbi:hypothetical protein AB0L82_09730 [Nocardia sp. NPDC052001]|uniref:hypothetical protein n=1 Tax=Nocardia sp. NPDC052001 TaxID=3154853 RepID=UPI00344193DE
MTSEYDWSWVEDLPSWKIPDELKKYDVPTAHNLAILLLSCNLLHNENNALVGRYITEYSNLNIWLASGGQQRMDAKAFVTLTSHVEQYIRRIYEAWKEFEATLKSAYDVSPEESRASIGSTSQSLQFTLIEAIDFMSQIREA